MIDHLGPISADSAIEDLGTIAKQIQPNGALPRFLVIDDNPNCFRIFKLYMTGCELVWADNGSKGFKILEDHSNMFDIVVIDELLPPYELFGQTLTRGHLMLRPIQERWRSLITCISTGYEFTAKEKEYLRNLPGPVVMLAKPLRKENLGNLLLWTKQSRHRQLTK